MIIDIKLLNNKYLITDCCTIGYTYENESTTLKFLLTEEMKDKDFYLEFEKPDGTKVLTPKLEVKDDIVLFKIPNSLLDVEGNLKVEVVLRANDIEVWKSCCLNFKVLPSINASEYLKESCPDFVHECEKVMNLINTTGDGTKYLANDGTYKAVAGGSSENAVVYLESSSDNLIYLRDLETNVYKLNGSFRAYNGSTTPLNFINALVCVNRMSSKSYITVIYPVSNRIQYVEVTDDNHTITQILLNSLLTRIEALEEKVG